MSAVVSLVEDDDEMRTLMERLLTSRGLRVVASRNGIEAFEMTRQGGVRPAVILLDWQMPIMDGMAFLERQASEPLLAGVPVLVITASSQVPAELPEVVRDVLIKPFVLLELVALIQRICAEAPVAVAPVDDPAAAGEAPSD